MITVDELRGLKLSAGQYAQLKGYEVWLEKVRTQNYVNLPSSVRKELTGIYNGITGLRVCASCSSSNNVWLKYLSGWYFSRKNEPKRVTPR